MAHPRQPRLGPAYLVRLPLYVAGSEECGVGTDTYPAGRERLGGSRTFTFCPYRRSVHKTGGEFINISGKNEPITFDELYLNDDLKL